MEKNQDKGFTLVELLIVIVILGILATVTVFAVRGITTQGQENACDVEARTLDTAIEAFYAHEPGRSGRRLAVIPTARCRATILDGPRPEYLRTPANCVFGHWPASHTPRPEPATSAVTATRRVRPDLTIKHY